MKYENGPYTLPPQNVTELDTLLRKDGLIVPVPYAEILKFTQEQISYWSHFAGVYQIPTIELIDFLRNEMSGRTIEIGAGNGCIGRAIGIDMYDSHAQERDDIRNTILSMGQPPVKYGRDVIELTANTAVKRVKPQTVIGCWVTQYGVYGNSFIGGIDELEMFTDGIEKYIMVGNEVTHRDKRVFKKRKVNKIRAPWIVSRSRYPEKNIIYIVT